MSLCVQAAHLRRDGVVEYDNAERARNCCGLEGFGSHRWEPDRLIKIHMGAPPRYDLEGQDRDWARPREDPEDGGCPGAWYRSAFVRGLAPYRRRMLPDGNRVQNSRLDQCDDRLIHDWIALLESYEDAAYGEYLQLSSGR